MRRTTLMLAILVAAGVAPAIAAQRGAVVIGTDPAVFDAVAAGAADWTATGYVSFAVEATGCGTGDLTFCVVWWEPDGHLACHNCAGWSRIDVDGFDLGRFGPADACHEIGHFLGLGYHRTDGLSCMSEPATVAAPDAIDLANLGWPPPAPPDDADKRVWTVLEPVLALPSTGAGTTADGVRR